MPLILRPEWALTPEGLRSGVELEIEGEWIREVRPSQAPPNLPGRLLLPGFVNAHSHAFQRGIRGQVQWTRDPKDDFWSWRDRMYRLANALTPEQVEAVSALAFLEMLAAGYTSVGEFHYLHHQPDGTPYQDPDELALRVLSAAQRVGIRIRLLRVAYARAGHQRDPDPLQRRFYDRSPEACLEAVARLEAAGHLAGLAPHSVRAVPDPWLRAFSGFSGVVHAHVDEQQREIDESLAERGRRPIEVFADAGLLTPSFTAVHLTWPSDKEIALLRQSGGRVCACPSTEQDLGDGICPVERLEGVGICVGSDSHALIDPLYEIRSLEWGARSVLRRRNVLSPLNDPDGLALRLLRAGSAEGAASLALPAGEIAAGRLADLVAIDLHDPSLAGARLLPALVFGGGTRLVREVWVGGRQLAFEGRHPLTEEVARAAERALREA